MKDRDGAVGRQGDLDAQGFEGYPGKWKAQCYRWHLFPWHRQAGGRWNPKVAEMAGNTGLHRGDEDRHCNIRWNGKSQVVVTLMVVCVVVVMMVRTVRTVVRMVFGDRLDRNQIPSTGLKDVLKI